MQTWNSSTENHSTKLYKSPTDVYQKQIQQTIQKSGTLTEKHTVNISHKTITIHSFCCLSYVRSMPSSEASSPLPLTLNTQLKYIRKMNQPNL